MCESSCARFSPRMDGRSVGVRTEARANRHIHLALRVAETRFVDEPQRSRFVQERTESLAPPSGPWVRLPYGRKVQAASAFRRKQEAFGELGSNSATTSSFSRKIKVVGYVWNRFHRDFSSNRSSSTTDCGIGPGCLFCKICGHALRKVWRVLWEKAEGGGVDRCPRRRTSHHGIHPAKGSRNYMAKAQVVLETQRSRDFVKTEERGLADCKHGRTIEGST